MEIWTLEKCLEGEGGTRNVEIRASPDRKLFRYYEKVWIAVDEDELLYHPDGGYWSCPEMSGYYASLEECELGAYSNIGWLERAL
ncbi:hypothetical protein GTA62_02460 [Roseobacter sp. HKCCD9010]|uniref:hypothetical protein n=1 Tax=unclassified Roseobacter TaxID=196798 RepID=UPI001492CEE0|nr:MULTISPECIES: hypothetical protein [unclassified Roseobacter]MBF9049272.1 hypothetical protein [Rhodobacterales bacterium HKCCD4356]NNV11272.1 hypothetical protein [Roseobacter sp. HKCCD7357]NNV15456.1 hypothetical protein [Roseobacter sp. HKCCD8768]NNV24916.1 hypothetical protein [Roseobacter sp. HKCCD8192]NNV29173.1 hypothetical protein [Roseobacter sp. HKCCD9061]